MLFVITFAFLYLRPHFTRGFRFLSRPTTAGAYSADELVDCVDTSSQLAVQLADGVIYGKYSEPADPSEPHVRNFFGIRYAASTAGSRRFSAAVASPPWSANGTFHAYEHGPPCAQMSPASRTPVGSEDCLTLSIWSPFFCRPTDMLKTVVVALSTDWFQTGHLADYQDSWRRMAAYGDVVVVALNVRLGALGYLRTPMKEAPGNAAFTDVAVALSWVHTNVGAFYGDHTQMVAVGLGGGGLLLAIDLLADERPAPYFKRHVIHGLSPMSLLPRNDVADARILAKNLGCLVDSSTFTEEILSCLRGRDYEDLVRASQMVGNLGFAPSREDKPLSFHALVTNVATSPLTQVSVLCGYSLRDALASVEYVLTKNNVTREGDKPREMMTRAARLFGHSNGTGGGANLPDRARAFLASLDRSGVSRLLVDAMYHCPLLDLASAVTERKGVAFFYVYIGTGLFEPVLNLTALIHFVKTG
ncbi:carboxylesterase 3A-like [Rhipicephalus microplus]|uniref:carboxylesterase 3A-like n=1 Tax=Rhipicephalus microplus TaxID=6941 RepID=UPI003F6C2983